jgi:hypothetical protein
MTQLNWNELLQAADSSGAGNYEPLPDGVYELKVVESEPTMSSTGKVMFKVKTEVQSGPHARRLVWDNIVISPENPKSMGIFFSQMGSLGLGKEFFGQQPSNEQIASGMKDRVFRGQVGKRTWNGQDRNEINRYMPMTAESVASVPGQVASGAPAPAPAPTAGGAPAPAPAPTPVGAPVAGGAAVPPAPPF